MSDQERVFAFVVAMVCDALLANNGYPPEKVGIMINTELQRRYQIAAELAALQSAMPNVSAMEADLLARRANRLRAQLAALVPA